MSAVEPQCPVLPGGEPCESPFDGVSDAEAAEWGRLAAGATGGPWRSAFYGDRDEWELSAEFVIVSYREPDTLSDADAAFIAAARTAVPRLLAEREALRAEVDRLSGLRLVDSVAAQAEEVASLTVERDRALGTIRIMLGDAAAEGRCGCAALYDGPQEDCPLHGRDYAWWVGAANQAYADLERLRGECRAVHPTNSTVVPCCLAAGHPEAEHMSTTGCAGSVMHWPTAEAELADARETIARLNARAQVAEAAIAELTGTGKGKAKRVAREIWTRCEESHGLACGTTRRARDFAAHLEAENALLSEGVERLSSKIYKLRREAMDDLMALDRVLYASAVHDDCEAAAPEPVREHPVCPVCWLTHPEGACDR